MKRLLLLVILLLTASSAYGQSGNVSQSSYKQAVTTQSITSTSAGTAIDTTGYTYATIQYSGTYTTNATPSGFQLGYNGATPSITAWFYQGSDCTRAQDTGDLTDNSTNVFYVPLAGANRLRTNPANWATGTISVVIVLNASPFLPCQALDQKLSSSTDSVTAKTDQTTHGTTDLVASDVTKVGGTAIDTNSGNKSAGTQRVVIATDQPNLTTALNINHAQVAGTTVDTNSGNKSAGTQRIVIATDQPNLTTPLNENVAQINGVAPLMGTGNSGTGAQRIVIATDQPAFTNSVPVTQKAATSTSATLQNAATANGNGTNLSADGMSSVVLTVNCSSCSGGSTVNFEGTEDGTNFIALNAHQLGSSTIAGSTTTSGVTMWQMPVAGFVNVRARISAYSAGTITVTGHSVAVDYGPKTINANIVANTASNQSVNVAQINGVTPLMGNGTSGTGAQRVSVSSDNTAIAGWGHGATGSAVPSGATYVGANSGGNLTGIIQGDTTVKIDVSTATTTQLVALSSSKKIYVTSFSVLAGGTGNFKFVYGTGSNCGTGTTDLTANYNFTAQVGIATSSGLGPLMIVPASQALCVTTSAAVQMSGHLTYSQF